MSIRFPLSTVPVQGRTATGVKAMSVESGDEVFWVEQLEEADELILFSERGWAKRIPQVDFEPQNRAGKGMPYVMAILDDIVTGVTALPAVVPEEPASPEAT